MSLELPYSIKVLSTESLDEKYLNGLVPYTSIAEVNSLLPVGIRSIGLTVNIANQEYWYKNNTTNGGLVLKIAMNNADLLHTTGNETKNGSLTVITSYVDAPVAIAGFSDTLSGVLGNSDSGGGIDGLSNTGIGVQGVSQTGLGGKFSTTTGTKIVSFLSNSIEQAYILATGLFKANKILINTTTDNGLGDALQVNGTISATAASTASQVVIKSQLNAKANIAITVRKIATNITLAESDNGTVILLTSSCTVTLPNSLSLGFNCSFVTAAGATMTYALGSSIVLINNTATTMGEKLSHTITNTGVLNEYITVGL
jgi:hypothetical protein